MSADQASNSLDRYQALLNEAERIRGVSLWQDAWRRLRRSRAAMGSLGFLILLGVLTFFTPVLPLQSPQVQDLRNRKFSPPEFSAHLLEIDLEKVALAEREIAEARTQRHQASGDVELKAAEEQLAGKIKEHPFNNLWTSPGPFAKLLIRTRLAIFGRWCIPSVCGTDSLGRDVLSRIFSGARISLIVGIVATAVSLIIGVSYGASAGYIGGWFDTIVMRIVDVLYSIPFIFVVIFLITFLSEEHIKAQLSSVGINQLIIFYFVIGAIYWLTMARVVRGQVISLKNEQFVDAARTIGAGTPRIIFRHLVPNVMGIVIVYLTLTIPSIILFEAFLSFLGLGVTPPDVSWGILVSDAILVISGLKTYWWLVLFPGMVFTVTLFSLNFLGDGLRDALDPKMKNR